MSSEIVEPLAIYGIPLLVTWLLYSVVRVRQTKRSRSVLRASERDGLMQPASLHPHIDPTRCLGCGACVDACPEKNVLGLVQRKAALITPANCVGHGACKEVCPFDAIDLVLGTAERGVEVPVLSSNFETSVEGVFVAGELGGMGLIRNAIRQGVQAMNALSQRNSKATADQLHVVIVGAGPAGLAAALAAHERQLRYRCLEQETLGGTVAHYPRGKLVMTSPATLPIYGEVPFRETSKEGLLELFEDAVGTTGVRIEYGSRVDAIAVVPGGFEIRTPSETIHTRSVLLALGRRGTPRKLGVDGEELPKVVYRMVDPEQYRGRKVLVVGGGDSALEAADAISRENDTHVTLSYRGDAFSRAKPKNRQAIEAGVESGRVQLMLSSEVVEIADSHVVIESETGRKEIANDDVIVCVGGILPTTFLESIGIEIVTRHGEAA